MDAEALKAEVCAAVDELADRLIALSHDLHANPELAFEEHHAHEVLTDLCAGSGLRTTRGACGLPTAFVAEAGTAGPVVAVVCEYDALPGIGHACGHNIIAAAGVGAGLAAARVCDRVPGRIRVVGTPAEEGGGGKVPMISGGAFDGVEAAMMVHPADADLTRMDAIAIAQIAVDYHGREAHAAAAPEQGRNALDAAVLGYVNVAALRQHIGPAERVHGIFTRAGDRPNVVPAHTSALWYVRSPTTATLAALRDRVLDCLRAGAVAAGCRMEVTEAAPTYAELRDNPPLVDLYAANAARLGRQVAPPGPGARVTASTDMGNVSQVVPSIHPMIAVAPPGVAIHTPEFATWAVSEAGDRAVLDGAKAMAMTVIDLWSDAAVREQVAAAFQAGGS